MVRQIIVPVENDVVLRLPDDMLGKKIEVLAFELGGLDAKIVQEPKISFEEFQKSFEGVTFSGKDFKFNRDEANDYD